jgi:hypothetical protein
MGRFRGGAPKWSRRRAARLFWSEKPRVAASARRHFAWHSAPQQLPYSRLMSQDDAGTLRALGSENPATAGTRSERTCIERWH